MTSKFRSENSAASLPFISVVIPTYNRPWQMASCLRSFEQTDYPRNRFELVIVDDGSPNTLDQIVAPFRDKFQLNLIKQANAGAGSARNTGAAAARGDYIAFTDDDCVPAADWLSTLAKAVKENPDEGFGGLTFNALPNNPCSTASQLLIDYLHNYYFPADENRFFASNNVIFSKKQFEQIGGFDTRFPRAGAEDRDFCRRWLAEGYGLTYVPQAKINHSHGMTLKGFIRQHFCYGRGAFYFHSFKKVQTKSKQLRVEPLRFYTRLLCYPYTVKTTTRPWLLVLLMFVSQAANAIGFFYERNRASRSAPLKSPASAGGVLMMKIGDAKPVATSGYKA